MQFPKTELLSLHFLRRKPIKYWDGHPRVNVDNILEEGDPKFDAMLGQMIGRITLKPAGKPEMGEASVVEKYNRPMPKLRNNSGNGLFPQAL